MFEDWTRQLRSLPAPPMPPLKSRPTPEWLAIRAATLAVDDFTRSTLVVWMRRHLRDDGGFGNLGPPSGAFAALIVAALLSQPVEFRLRYRDWFARYVNGDGHLITPAERRRERERSAEAAGRPWLPEDSVRRR